MSNLLLVDGAAAKPAERTSLTAENLEERRHLQEWIVASPEVLGDDVRVVCIEYDRWEADIDGKPARHRLDILAIDGVGRLIVAELKRGDAGHSIHLQAVTYAAMVSRFDMETLAQAHATFLSRGGDTHISEAEARALLVDHISGELDPTLLKRPRLVLVASSFPVQVTNTVVWLSEQGLDITLLQFSLWRVADRLVAEFSTLYPTPVEAEFTLKPRRREADVLEERIEQRTRSKNAAHLLLEAGLPPAGTRFRVVPAHGTTAEIRDEIATWMAEKDDRRWATWRNDRSKPVCWQEDGAGYSATGLAELIFNSVKGRAAPGIQGTAWFVLDDESCPDDVDPDLWATLQDKTLVEISQIVGTSSKRRADIIDRLLAADVPAE